MEEALETFEGIDHCMKQRIEQNASEIWDLNVFIKEKEKEKWINL